MENLSIGLCSECDRGYRYNGNTKMYFCICGWSMSKKEFDDLMSVRESQSNEYHIPDYDENLSELNNLKL